MTSLPVVFDLLSPGVRRCIGDTGRRKDTHDQRDHERHSHQGEDSSYQMCLGRGVETVTLFANHSAAGQRDTTHTFRHFCHMTYVRRAGIGSQSKINPLRSRISDACHGQNPTFRSMRLIDLVDIGRRAAVGDHSSKSIGQSLSYTEYSGPDLSMSATNTEDMWRTHEHERSRGLGTKTINGWCQKSISLAVCCLL